MQDKDFQWFLSNYDKLFQTHGRSFIVVKNETVLGSYPSFKEALDATSITEDPGTFIIQECDGSESAYTVHIASMNFI